MIKTVIHEIKTLGQSIWLDTISRSLIQTGRLSELIEEGLSGLTSNPTIFEKTVASSHDYDELIANLLEQGKTTFQIYDELTVRDIQDAADVFQPLWEQSGAQDGYVSLEINPHFAHDTHATIAEGTRLFYKVSRPNVIFKVPATEQGCTAIEALIAEGIPVNCTLIFSLEQYIDAAYAYLRGLRRRIAHDQEVRGVRSVASVFVSRVDTIVDKKLDNLITQEKAQEKKDTLRSLQGKAAIANAERIYQRFLDIFTSEDYLELAEAGAQKQQLVWASTSTKNPAYSDIKYVAELIGQGTVNTVPEATFAAVIDHGRAEAALPAQQERTKAVLNRLRLVSISIDRVCDELLRRGVAAFRASFDSLLASIEQKGTLLCPKQR